jgi:hypothetical protein
MGRPGVRCDQRGPHFTAKFLDDALDEERYSAVSALPRVVRRVQGDSGDDVLLGGNGNDNIGGDCFSHDRIDGGPGTDTCSFDPDNTTAVSCETLSLCP